MRKTFTLIFLIALFQSCSNEELKNRDEYETELESLYGEIELLISNGNCDDHSDCNTMEIGDKPCGGPSGYLIFSTDIDYAKLESLASRYTRLQKEYNDEFGIASDCSIVSPPENIGCLNSKCGTVMN